MIIDKFQNVESFFNNQVGIFDEAVQLERELRVDLDQIKLKLFLPLLKGHCIITPDVVGMPGKSAPFRTLDTNKDDFGRWLCEVLDRLDIKEIPFVVSSYSSAMLLSLAEISPDRIKGRTGRSVRYRSRAADTQNI